MHENQGVMTEESGTTGGITFKDVFNFLKLAGVRILIYLACALVAAGVILAGMMLFTGDAVTTTRIEYTYNGIDVGLSPDGSAFNQDEIRAAKVLSDAIEKTGLKNKIPSVELLREKVVITGVLTDRYVQLQALAADGDEAAKEELRNYKFFPTRYDIQIKNVDELGITESESRRLLDNITLAYREYFKKDWVLQEYSLDIYEIHTSDKAQYYDYAEFYDIYTERLNQISDGLTSLARTDGGYRSPTTKKTFNDLLSSKTILSKKYDDYIAFIMSGGISKNIDEAIRNLEKSIELAEIDVVKFTADKKNLEEQIEKYPYNTLIVQDGKGGVTEYREYPDEFHTLQLKLTDVNYSLTAAGKQIDIYTSRLEAFKALLNNKPDETDLLAAANKLAFIIDESVSYVKQVNDTLYDYYEFKFGVEAIQVLQPAVTVTLRNMPTLLIIAAAALIAIVAALFVTQIKKKLALKPKAVNTAPAASETSKL